MPPQPRCRRDYPRLVLGVESQDLFHNKELEANKSVRAGRWCETASGVALPFWSANYMKRDKEPVAEIRCPACSGTGFPEVKQPVEPGRKIYPAPCKECAGKGRVAASGA